MYAFGKFVVTPENWLHEQKPKIVVDSCLLHALWPSDIIKLFSFYGHLEFVKKVLFMLNAVCVQ